MPSNDEVWDPLLGSHPALTANPELAPFTSVLPRTLEVDFPRVTPHLNAPVVCSLPRPGAVTPSFRRRWRRLTALPALVVVRRRRQLTRNHEAHGAVSRAEGKVVALLEDLHEHQDRYAFFSCARSARSSEQQTRLFTLTRGLRLPSSPFLLFLFVSHLQNCSIRSSWTSRRR